MLTPRPGSSQAASSGFQGKVGRAGTGSTGEKAPRWTWSGGHLSKCWASFLVTSHLLGILGKKYQKPFSEPGS